MGEKINAQVVVLGAGPAGYSAAFRCADLGLETVLIERYERLGGVCLNVGCIPSKALLHIAKVIRENRDIFELGIFENQPKIKIDKIQIWKERIINQISTGLKNIALKRKIKTIFGIAKFIDSNTIRVESKKTNDIIISFKNAIIAVGSKSLMLPSSFPFRTPLIWNSTDALSLPKIPGHLLIVGGGIIGLEMATIYSSLGSAVDVIEHSSHIFPEIDKDVVDVFKNSTKDNFNLLLGQTIISAVENSNSVSVKIQGKDNQQKNILYDAVIVAVGRVPNTQTLNINCLNIKTNSQGFIIVDKQLKTNQSHIFAVGDVVGKPMLAHKGMYEAHIAAEVIAGKKHFFDPKVIPCVAYTDPEVAWVGISESMAIKKNINYEVSIFPWSASGRAVASNSSKGLTKLVFDKDTNQIIGGMIVGVNAGELLSEITLAIEMGCDVEDIALTIHAHPTLYETIGLSSQVFQGTITDLINLKSKIRL